MTLKWNGQMLQPELRDDGRGISPEHPAKIFGPFFATARGQGAAHRLYDRAAKVSWHDSV